MLALPRNIVPPHSAPPMPADLLYCIPETAHMRAAEMGALLALLRAFWLGRAQSLPRTESALMALSGAHLRQWQAIRPSVLKAWEALEPIAATVYARINRVAAKRALIAAHARSFNTRRPKTVESLTDASPIAALMPRTQKSATIKHTTHGDVIPTKANRAGVALTDAPAPTLR